MHPSRHRPARSAALGAIVALAGCGSPGADPATGLAPDADGAAPNAAPSSLPTGLGRHDFEALTSGALPPGFTPATTLGRPQLAATPATWRLAEGGATATSSRCLQLAESANRDEIFNLLLLDAPAPADVAVAVKLRAESGREDRGGGVVWRVQDAQNYYVARWNPLEDNVRLYRVVASRRVQLSSAPAKVARDAWHLLEVTMIGRVITVRLDGEPKLSLADQTFRDAGRVGLWTRSDACSAFDDFTVSAAAASP